MLVGNEFIISSYNKNFSKFFDKKIAIYGIGKNTKIIIDNCNVTNVIGLMDETRAGESLFGFDIITMEQALERNVDLIVIVARASNVKVIFRRIAQACAAHSIPVYDINGDELVVSSYSINDYSSYANIKFDVLKERIKDNDVISFDIFDTLVFRDVLYSYDIFSLIERKVQKNFRMRRIAAETALYAEGRNPTLPEIYERLGGCFDIGLELDMERRHLFCKPSGFAAYAYARQQGKEIFFIADTYFDGDILHSLLNYLGYDIERDHIVVSCEHDKSISHGLFGVLRERISGNILHICDKVDLEFTTEHHKYINESFYLPNGLKMLKDSYASHILKFDGTLENRCVIGRFLQAFFQDSFLFQRTQGKIEVLYSADVAQFVAPFVMLFYGWLLNEVRRQGLTHVLLFARDGRILQDIHEYYSELHNNLPKFDYFYISRAVAVLAGIISDEDILHAYRFSFNGSVHELLQKRFGLSADDLLLEGNMVEERYVLAHREQIMRKAKELRERFLYYISSIIHPSESKIGVFDFISSATCLKGLMNVVQTKLIGLFVGLLYDEAEYKPEAEIHHMFEKVTFNVFKNEYNICVNYFLLENIFTSAEPSLCGFTSTGKPIFERETRTQSQIDDLKTIHEGILGYIKSMDIDIYDITKIDLKLVDDIYGLFSAQYVENKCQYFEGLVLDDSFCQRTFRLNMN